MLQWLRRLKRAPEGDWGDLQARLSKVERQLRTLEANELERESTVADQVDKLTRLFKRFQQRKVADRGEEEEDGTDDITRRVLARRRHAKGGD